MKSDLSVLLDRCSLLIIESLKKVENIVSNESVLFCEIDFNSLPKPRSTTPSIMELAIERTLSMDPEGWL